MHRQYRQVTAKRDITGNAFPRGVIDYDFSIGSNMVWHPSRSYFRVGLRLDGAGGNAPTLAEKVAFSNLAPACLFDNCYFQMGGQNVSQILQYLPQAAALRYRVGQSAAWSATTGKDGFGFDPNLERRLAKSASDSFNQVDPQPYHNYSPDDPNQNIVYLLFQAPLGITENEQALEAGEYRYSFNPASDYKNAAVQSDIGNKTAGVEYDISVESMELYICTEKVETSPTRNYEIFLRELNLQSKKIINGEQNFDFTVPSTTYAVAIFVQSQKAGNNIGCPPTLFGTLDANDTLDAGERSLSSLQLTYGNITKPPTRWSSDYDLGGRTSKLTQRWLDTHMETGRAMSVGGCESLQDWMNGGIFNYYTFERGTGDQCTQLQLQINNTDLDANSNHNVFIAAFYERKVEIQVQNGFVANVMQLTV